MNTRILLFTMLLGLFACKEESSRTVIQGTVTDYGTGKPGKNAGVYLVQSSDGGGFSLSKKIVDSIAVDANGKFYHAFEWQGGGYSVFPVGYEEFYMNRPNNDFVNIFKGRTNTVHLVNEPKGFLTVHVKNVNPYDYNDLVSVGINGTAVNSGRFYGTTVDQDVQDYSGRSIFPVSGNMYCGIRWNVVHNNDTLLLLDSVYVPAFDTTTFTINY